MQKCLGPRGGEALIFEYDAVLCSFVEKLPDGRLFFTGLDLLNCRPHGNFRLGDRVCEVEE